MRRRSDQADDRHPLIEVVEHVTGGIATTLENGKQPAGEERLAREPELGVAQAPALALARSHLALEVDRDRPPVSDHVVEQKPRRAVMLDVGVEVAGEKRSPRSHLCPLAAHRHGLEDEQRAAREVGVGVLVAPDLASQVLEPYLRAEDLLGARRASAENLGHPIDSGVRVLASRSLEQNHEIVVALAGDLAATPRPHQHHGRSRVDLDGAKSLPALAESALGPAASGRYTREPRA